MRNKADILDGFYCSPLLDPTWQTVETIHSKSCARNSQNRPQSFMETLFWWQKSCGSTLSWPHCKGTCGELTLVGWSSISQKSRESLAKYITMADWRRASHGWIREMFPRCHSLACKLSRTYSHGRFHCNYWHEEVQLPNTIASHFSLRLAFHWKPPCKTVRQYQPSSSRVERYRGQASRMVLDKDNSSKQFWRWG